VGAIDDFHRREHARHFDEHAQDSGEHYVAGNVASLEMLATIYLCRVP